MELLLIMIMINILLLKDYDFAKLVKNTDFDNKLKDLT